MKVFYTGRFREPALNYRGVVFCEGLASDVTDEWFDRCPDGKVELEAEKPKRKRRTKAEMEADEAIADDDSD